MKLTLSFLALLAPFAQADLVITEVMSKSLHQAANLDGDWWELTNTGTEDVDLSGYTWDDTPTPELPSISPFPDVSIAAGESIVILQEDQVNLTAWKLAWGLGATKVLAKDTFPVDAINSESFSSFSKSGDEVNLYDPEGKLVAHVEFGAAVEGSTQAWLRDGRPIYGLHSNSGKHGATASGEVIGDIGSPCDSGLQFVSAPEPFAPGSYSSHLVVQNPGGATINLSPLQKPEFLDLVAGDAGEAELLSSRPLTLADAGNHLVQIRATSGSKSTVQEFLVSVFNPSPTMILNEYNAVSGSNYLNGGDAFEDLDGGAPSEDSHFERIPGNGGNWVEFVVVGDGGPGEVDLRGWTIEIGKDKGSGFEAGNRLMLSDHADWEAVPSGTILTFIENDTSQGGLDSGMAIRDRRETLGDIWSNVWMGDPDRLVYLGENDNGYQLVGGVVSGIDIGNSGTQFRIKDGTDAVVFGPVGEGIAPLSGTSSEEVFELENHPDPSVSPIVATGGGLQGYDDGASGSTFGSPNNWLEMEIATTQDFTPYAFTAFDAWAQAKGLSGEDASRTADPDEDGRDNLNEYSFGGSPMEKDGPYPAGGLTVGSAVTWSVVRRANDPSLSFSYEASADSLEAWSGVVPTSSIAVPFAGDPDFESVMLEFPMPDPLPAQWFLRSRVD